MRAPTLFNNSQGQFIGNKVKFNVNFAMSIKKKYEMGGQVVTDSREVGR